MSSNSILSELEKMIADLERSYNRFNEHPSRLEIDLIKEKLRTIYDLVSEVEPGGEEKREKREEKREKREEKREKREEKREIVEDAVEEVMEEPEPVIEKPLEVEDPKDNGVTLAEKFMAGDDRTVAAKITKSVIQDLKTAIRLNDKFVFIKELFNNNVLEYNEAVDQLNIAGSKDKAEIKLLALKEKYQWTVDTEPFLRFTEYIDKKYS